MKSPKFQILRSSSPTKAVTVTSTWMKPSRKIRASGTSCWLRSRTSWRNAGHRSSMTLCRVTDQSQPTSSTLSYRSQTLKRKRKRSLQILSQTCWTSIFVSPSTKLKSTLRSRVSITRSTTRVMTKRTWRTAGRWSHRTHRIRRKRRKKWGVQELWCPQSRWHYLTHSKKS